ncbi:MAG: hypothetical protein MUQ57_03915, partial [Porticoccus sp.]|nr:hypothetical protein [Porticoccus sp.]
LQCCLTGVFQLGGPIRLTSVAGRFGTGALQRSFLPVRWSLGSYILRGALYSEPIELGTDRVGISRQYYEYTLAIGQTFLITER